MHYSPLVLRDTCLYASRYCEENVWQLAQAPELAGLQRSAVFITNARKTCALWHQRSAQAPGEPVLWDYHVVLLTEGDAPRLWDLDSDLPFPSPALDYLSATFPFAGSLPPEVEPRFRLVPAEELLQTFASDRSHMRAPDGSWHAPPPPWPPIATAGETMTLPRYLDLRLPQPGQVLKLAELRARLR